MLRTTIEKEWAEVRRKGLGKVEDWTWCVTYYDTREWGDNLMDRHWMKTEEDAKMRAAMFESGNFKYGEYGQVLFDNAFGHDDVDVSEEVIV